MCKPLKAKKGFAPLASRATVKLKLHHKQGVF